MSIWGEIKKLVTDPLGSLQDAIGWLLGIEEPDEPSTEINIASTDKGIPVVYGKRKLGGFRVFADTSGTDNKYLYMAIVLCEGQIEAIDEVYIDDIISTDSKFSGLITIQKFTGSDSQTASTVLSESPKWDSTYKLSGLAYIAIKIKYDKNKMNSLPSVTAVVRGKRCYNPFKATPVTEYTANPVVCLYDYLTNTRYGKGLSASDIDVSGSFQDAYDFISDFVGAATTTPAWYWFNGEVIEYSTVTANESLYNTNIILDTDQTLFNNVKHLLVGMRSFMPYTQGKYGLVLDKDVPDGYTFFDFNEDNILSKIQVKPIGTGKRYNRVTAKFDNPETSWKADEVTWPEKGSQDETDFLAEDNNVVLSKTVTLKSVIDQYVARDYARLYCLLSRKQDLMVSFDATSEALQCAVGDVIRLEHESLGWTNEGGTDARQFFRITSMALNENGSVAIQGQKYDASIYPWDTGLEIIPGADTNLPDPYTMTPPIAPFTATSGFYITVDGTVQYYFDLEWTDADNGYLDFYKVYHRTTGDQKYTVASVYDNFYRLLISDTGTEANPQTYDFQVTAVSTNNIESSALTISAAEVDIDITAPNAPAVTATGGIKSVNLSWTNPTDSDLKHINIYVNTSDDYNTATLLASVDADSYIHAGLSAGDERWYWLKAVDYSGNVSGSFGTGSAKATVIAAPATDIDVGGIDLDLANNNNSGFVNETEAAAAAPVQSVDGATGTVTVRKSGLFGPIVTNDNAAPSNTEFNTVAGRDPIEGDFVTTKDTTPDPDVYYGWAYRSNAWVAVSDFLHGDLIVDGTIAADKITANSIDTTKLTVGIGTSLSNADSALQDSDTGVNLGLTGGSVGGITITSSSLYAGAGNWANADTGFYLDNTGKFSLDNKLSFDPTTDTLRVDGLIEAVNLTVTGEAKFANVTADNVKVGSITYDMLSGEVKNAFQADIAISTGGTPGDFQEDSGIIPSTVDLPVFSHGSKPVEITLTASNTGYHYVDYTTAQRTATYTVQRATDAAFTANLQTIGTGSIIVSAYDISGYYGGSSTVFYHAVNFSVLITDDPSLGDYYYRVTFSAGSAFSDTNIQVTANLAANEAASGVTSSGGNADTLDNLDSTKFMRTDEDTSTTGNLTVGGDLSVTGDLNITGNINSYNVTDLDVSDVSITLNAGGAALTADGAGIYIEKAVDASTDASITWNATDDIFVSSHGFRSTNVSLKADRIANISFARKHDTTNGSSVPNEDIDQLGTFVLSKTDGGYGAGTKPTGSHNGVGVISLQTHTGNYFTQLALDTNQNSLWIRSADNSATFGAWTKLYSTADFTNNATNWNTAYTYSQVGHLPLAGGTIGGGNVANPLTISRAGATASNICIAFSEDHGTATTKYFGLGGDEFRIGDSADLGGSGKTVWHSGNLTNNSSNWNTAYTYSQVGHLPLSGGTMTGALELPELRIGSSSVSAYGQSIESKSSYLLLQRNEAVPIEIWGSEIQLRKPVYFGSSGSTSPKASVDASGNFDIESLKINGTTVIDSSRNLTNIAAITATSSSHQLGYYRAMQLTGSGIGSSYDERVVLLCPKVDSNTAWINIVDGKLTALKTGGNVCDTFDVFCHSVWNEHVASFTSRGQRVGHKLVTCTYAGITWIAIKFSFTANPYNYFLFSGQASTTVTGNNGHQLKVISYYDVRNGGTVLNSDIYNSITDFTPNGTYWTSSARAYYLYNPSGTSAYATVDANGIDIQSGGLEIGGTTVIDSTRQNIYLNSAQSTSGNGIFFRDGFTYNCSITCEDHNGNFADGLHISAYDGVSIGTGSNDKSTDLLVDVSGNTNIYGHTNSVGGYKVNGTEVIDSSRNLTSIGHINSTYLNTSTTNGLKLGQFSGGDVDEWPYVIWYRDTGNNWDEGLIKGSSSRGVFGRSHYGIHMSDQRSFAIHSSGWDTEAEFCGDGRTYIKGPVGIGLVPSSTSSDKLAVNGTVNATSLTIDGGSGFGEYHALDKVMTVTTSWQDISEISGGTLATGTYALSAYIYNSGAYLETYTGIMQWYGSGTNDNDANEIVLHHAGHADNGPSLYLRTLRRYSSTMILQIASNSNFSSTTVSFKFRRLI